MTLKTALRSPVSRALAFELTEWPDFAQPILTQTSYELQGDLKGNK